MMAQRAHQGVAAAQPPGVATISSPPFSRKQNKNLTKKRNIEFLRITCHVVLASVESARKANSLRLGDRAAIYRASNGISVTAGNRR
jgi:hypothetical protein